ncbi:MAG: nicotinate dehydrogenase subunit, partial [Rhodospirillaceae bacterium]|nr:nicotinate dehydrogenase subunit [Rhodospirillaceae bacterium]
MSRSLDRDAGLTRRRLLATGGGLVVGFCFARPLAAAVGSDAPGANEVGPKSVAPDEVDAFLSIARDGRATIFSGKVELGTGVATALTQIAAEELDLPVARVDLVQGDTALTPDQGVTYGSLSIQVGGVQLRQAAATARAALLRQAAAELDAPLDDLTLADGVVRARSSGRQVTYGALIGGRNLSLKLDPHAAPKPPSDYKLVGTSVARLDIPAKVVGQFTYMQDVRLPGMLHGRPIRPPAIGAMLRDVHERSVRSIPGNVRVVRAGDFLAVVADTEWAAIQGAQQLKARWSAWAGLPEQSRLWDHVRATPVVRDDVTSDIGDVSVALPQAARRISASYDFAIHTHGSIGPSCAVAVFENHKLICWSASQGPHALRRQLAEMMGIPQADVRVIYVEGAGCYGRNGHEDAAADAALLARATRRPVRVQWMRQDEHGWDPKGPPTLIDLEGGLTAADDVVAWRSGFFTPDGSAGNVPLIAASLAGMPHETTMSPGKILGDSAIPYSF